MRKLYSTFLCFLLCQLAFAQSSKQDQEIWQEGWRLYRSEMASWYGTDVFMEQMKEKTPLSGGYLSYPEGEVTKCIFFTKGDIPTTLATITFDSTFNVHQAQLNQESRALTPAELELFTIRKTALERIKSDTLFKHFNNTSLNLIPVIDQQSKRVYVLTGPQKNGVVIFGNDYLLTFDKKNKITQVKRLHQNLIPVQAASEDKSPDKIIVTTMHTHTAETGDHITATDVCTLLLYQKFTTWQQHIVMTPKNVCIWDCKKSKLATLTKEAWEKMSDGQKFLGAPKTTDKP
ncbi:MAG: hypothetical protein ACO1OQ_03705 [Rufibacter sp.]